SYYTHLLPPHPTPTLFPYTTLFRSRRFGAEGCHTPYLSPRARAQTGIVRASCLEFCHGFSLRADVKARCMAGLPASALRELRREDRKSTRLNSSHRTISYAVFCLKK